MKLTIKHMTLAAATFFALTGMAQAQGLVERGSKDMSCKEFVDLNPKAMTPVAFWVLNRDTDFKGGDYVDWNEVDEISVPKLVKICNQKPESKLSQWINEIK